MTEETKPRRARGSGRIFRPGNSKFFWIQYYGSDGIARRESSKSTSEREAEKLLRKRIGAVAAGVAEPDARTLRFEDVRRSFLLERMTRLTRGLPRKRDGSLRLGEDNLPRLSPVTRLDGFFTGMKVKNHQRGYDPRVHC